MTKCSGSCIKAFIRKNLLPILTLIGVILGFILGLSLKTTGKWTSRNASYVMFTGELWLNMLRCMVIPLITSSIITSIGNVELKFSKIIAFKGFTYYLCTTVIAVLLGIILVTSIEPGRIGKKPILSYRDKQYTCNLLADTVLDLFRWIVPPNILQANIEKYKTIIQIILPNQSDSITNGTTINNAEMISDDRACTLWSTFNGSKKALEDMPTEETWTPGTNIIGIITYSLALAVACVYAGEAGRPLLDFFSSFSQATMLMTTWIIWLSPIGILFLIAGQILMNENIVEQFETLGFYFMTVLLGLLIHGFIILPGIYAIFMRKLPFQFMGLMIPALLTAFGTSSSYATIPITTSCLEKKAKIDPRIVKFLIPIGATINLDGTGLYEAVAAIYISQVDNMSLDVGKVFLVSLTATLASIGAAGIPLAGLVTMVMILNTIGLPAERVTYIIAVDWLLDRFRTAVNVWGDSVGVCVTAKLCKKQLDKIDAEEEEQRLKAAQSTTDENKSLLIETLVDEENPNSIRSSALETDVPAETGTDELSSKKSNLEK